MLIHQFADVFQDFDQRALLSHRLPVSQPLIQRFQDAADSLGLLEQINRGELGTDADNAIAQLMQVYQRGITSATSGLPVRENLQAEAIILTPVETPLRNRLPRVPGAGLSAQWRVLTSFGTNLGTLAATSGTINTINTIKVANARGLFAGEQVLYAGATYTISSINYTTNVLSGMTGVGANSQTDGQSVVKVSGFFPESGANSSIFYGESGAPTQSTESWVNKTAGYKLLGDMGNITLFAMAAGANFQNQYATTKKICLLRTMLKEEYALLHADSSVTVAPWGDGTSALSYLGLIPWMKANLPSAQWQTSVGALTIEHLQQQLNRMWYQGGRKRYILVSGQEAQSLSKIAQGSGNNRLLLTAPDATLGVQVAAIIPAIGEGPVPIIVHPFLPAGTIVFGSDTNQEMQPTAQVSVLPQVMESPETTFTDNIQGYYAQDIAPTATAIDVMNFAVKVYSVPQWENTQVFALSEGVTAA